MEGDADQFIQEESLDHMIISDTTIQSTHECTSSNDANALQLPTRQPESPAIPAPVNPPMMQGDSLNFFSFPSGGIMATSTTQYPQLDLSLNQNIDHLISEACSWSTVDFSSSTYNPAEYSGPLDHIMNPSLLSNIGTHTSFDGFPSSSQEPLPQISNGFDIAPRNPGFTNDWGASASESPSTAGRQTSSSSDEAPRFLGVPPSGAQYQAFHCMWWTETRCPGIVFVAKTECTRCQLNGGGSASAGG
ncbi:hypothetical protein MMC14_004531 [Varicellaria rhodocarpa]|nr:hypothetical protein [Varicellaria rhodocarpa]